MQNAGTQRQPGQGIQQCSPDECVGGMVDSLLFVHAGTGCDTTSAVYCKCKRLPFRKLQAQPSLCTAVQVFNDLEQPDTI